MATAAKHKVTVVCSHFKDHRKVKRFKEDGDGGKIGSVYIDKKELKAMGDPDKVKVTVEAA